MEIWKPIIGYEGFYSISSSGYVKREMTCKGTRVGKILKARKTKRGYMYVDLYKNTVFDRFYIARLVAAAFIGNRPENFQVNHKDGNKSNNNFSNLEYVTRLENISHAWKNGLCHPVRGERNYFAKLNKYQVMEIRDRYSKGGITLIELGKKYNIGETATFAIIHRINWKHI